MRYLVAILLLAALPASAIDYEATPESVWLQKVGALPSFPVTASALRSAIEWCTFGGPVPKVNSATHYGLRLKRWDRLSKHFGFAAIADDYEKFLHELKAELAQTNKQ